MIKIKSYLKKPLNLKSEHEVRIPREVVHTRISKYVNKSLSPRHGTVVIFRTQLSVYSVGG